MVWGAINPSGRVLVWIEGNVDSKYYIKMIKQNIKNN